MKTAVTVDGELNAKGKAKHWQALYAIPFDELYGADNVPPRKGDTWRVNFFRIDAPEKDQQEYYAWSKIEKSAFHLPWRFGYLRFE